MKRGCSLDFPDIYAESNARNQLRSNISTGTSKQQVDRADGLLATCLQHEDGGPRNGVLFIDFYSKLKRDYGVSQNSPSSPKSRGRPDEAQASKIPFGGSFACRECVFEEFRFMRYHFHLGTARLRCSDA